MEKNQLRLLSSIVDHIDQMISVTNLSGDIIYVNSYFLKKYGYAKDEIFHRNINLLKSGDMRQDFYKDLWNTILLGRSFHGVFTNKHKNGNKIIEKKTITPIKDAYGNINFFASISQDITDLINEHHEYKNKYFKDPLTGLNNRLLLEKTLDSNIKKHENKSNKFSLILLDIDDFKHVNDTYGHDHGDEVLINFSKLIKKTLRKSDLVFRWGGEEFIVIVNEDIKNSKIIAEKLRKSVEEKVKINSESITISLGITQVKENDTKETLFKRVDDALYESKKTGKNKVSVLM